MQTTGPKKNKGKLVARLLAVQVLIAMLFVGLCLLSEKGQASQTGVWSTSGSTAQSATGGSVTSVSVSAPPASTSLSGWELRGAATLSAPNNTSYVPNVRNNAGLELLFDPNGSGSRRITFTFSNPVTDPVLHVDRLGGFSSGTNSSAWTLNTSASNGALSLQRVSGVSHFRVENSERFLGSVNLSASNWDGECDTSASAGAACGSVRIRGTFTTLVFDVQMQGNGGSGDAVELAFTLNQDLGDAPSSYGRAIHGIGQSVTRYLGSTPPDDDANGNEYSNLANTDDNTGTDDEGAISNISFTKGESAQLTLAVNEPTVGSSYLNAWIDWNANGVFDSSEQVATDLVNNGAGDQDNNGSTVTLAVDVPANAASGAARTRLRWSSQSGLAATGGAGDGEVEDHTVNVASAPLSCDAAVTNSLQLSASAFLDTSTNEVTLTRDTGNQSGSAWSANRISLLSAFSVEFSVYLGTKNASGADGIAFAFQNDPDGSSAVGNFGGALGVGGLEPAVAVEFDTYENDSDYNDIGNDHTMIYNPLNYSDSAGGGASSRYSEVVDLGNIEDGDWHTVQLNWDPVSNQLQYFFDGSLVTVVTRDFLNDVFGGDPNVFFGFTASTGGSSNLQKVCLIDAPPQSLVDYGDAPASYKFPSHIIVDGIYLGNGVTEDAGSYNDANASADGLDDGVIFPSVLPSIDPITVTVEGAGGYLQAWVDWNQDGDFDDAGEQIAEDLQDTDGDGQIDIIASAATGTVNANDVITRFRWSTTPSIDPYEGADDGEVEDYQVSTRAVVSCPQGSEATGGGIASGGAGDFRDAIYWLDWSCGARNNYQAGEIVRKSWVFGPVEIRATLDNLTDAVNVYNTGSWSGDRLDDLYQGVNPIGLSNTNGLAPAFDIDWQVYLNGQRVPADIIAADAEDTDQNESLTWETDGQPWEIFSVSPASDLKVRFENANQRMVLTTGDLPIGTGTVLGLTEDARRTSHIVNGSGVQAVAFGVFLQVDHGDIAGGYPQSGGHVSRRDATGGSKPQTDTDVNTLTVATLQPAVPYLGDTGPDPEDADQNSANADADGPEEDGVSFSPLIPGGNAVISITLTEQTAGTNFVQGWIDWNRDNDFDDASEQVALNVRDNDTQDSNPANGTIELSVFVPPGAFIGDTYARFRLSSTPDVAAGGQVVFDGEVEDYKVSVASANTAGTLSGWVFEDNGTGAVAHDGDKGDDEPGLANLPVRLYHDADHDGVCAQTDTVLAETTTDGDGAWALTPPLADVGKAACLLVQTPNGYQSISENAGAGGASLAVGAADDDTMTLSVPSSGTVWSDILFGDVGLPVLEPDRQGVVDAGSSLFYEHRFTARTAGTVDFTLGAADTVPAAPAWTDTLYRDSNCNGVLDSGEAAQPVTGVAVQAGDSVCLLVKVFAPADAPLDALHSRPLLASQAFTGTGLQAQVQVRDTTRLSAGKLRLEKQVRNIGPDGVQGTADDVDSSDGTANQAAPGDVLRYRLIFSNQGAKALAEVTVNDSTPAFSALNAAAVCPAALPDDLSGCSLSTPDGSNGPGYEGALQWLFSGQLLPGNQGVVRYDVRVNP